MRTRLTPRLDDRLVEDAPGGSTSSPSAAVQREIAPVGRQMTSWTRTIFPAQKGATRTRPLGAIPAGLPALQVPRLDWGSIRGLAEPALIVALLGSIDSLLTSLVADSQTRTRHNPNRELVGQGLGKLAAGILGALPGAGATMGTVTSIRAGGRSPLAGALAAILLLALLLGFGWIAEPIPLAVLAGILMKVGWDIVDWRFVLRLRAIRGEYVLIMLLTFLVTVFVDLVTAVALGLIAAGIVRSRDLGRGELDSVLSVPLLDSSDAAHLVDGGHRSLSPAGRAREVEGTFLNRILKRTVPRDRRRHRG